MSTKVSAPTPRCISCRGFLAKIALESRRVFWIIFLTKSATDRESPETSPVDHHLTAIGSQT